MSYEMEYSVTSVSKPTHQKQITELKMSKD